MDSMDLIMLFVSAQFAVVFARTRKGRLKSVCSRNSAVETGLVCCCRVKTDHWSLVLAKAQ